MQYREATCLMDSSWMLSASILGNQALLEYILASCRISGRVRWKRAEVLQFMYCVESVATASSTQLSHLVLRTIS